MNTPSHAIINPAVLGSRKGELWPVVLGSVLPDLPIFAFYFHHRFYLGEPELQIWDKEFLVTAWKPVVDCLHSFPVLLLALALAYASKRTWAKLLVWSLLLHAAVDFPLHVEDAHRQFFPLSMWRFQSPLSYWDWRHFGFWGALLETVCVLASLAVLFRRHPGPRTRWSLAALAGFYIASYILFYPLYIVLNRG